MRARSTTPRTPAIIAIIKTPAWGHGWLSSRAAKPNDNQAVSNRSTSSTDRAPLRHWRRIPPGA